LPGDLQDEGVTVAITWAYYLEHQFTSTSDITQLRLDGVLVNKKSAPHGDVFFQVWLREASKIAVIGSKNTTAHDPTHGNPRSMKPSSVREEAEKVFTHGDFYYIHFSPLSKLPEKTPQNKKNVEWIEEHINRIGITNGAGWIPIWFELYRDWTNYVDISPLTHGKECDKKAKDRKKPTGKKEKEKEEKVIKIPSSSSLEDQPPKTPQPKRPKGVSPENVIQIGNDCSSPK